MGESISIAAPASGTAPTILGPPGHPHAPGLPPPPKSPAAPAPHRRAASIRRTSSIDVCWPNGREGAMRVSGRARDIVTPADGGAPRVLAEGRFEADLANDRTILSIAAVPAREDVAGLAGHRAGGHLRAAIAERLGPDKAAGTPLHLILDDIAGSSLIAPWAWSRWDPDWLERMTRLKADPAHAAQFDRANICIGLATGSSGLSFGAEGAPTPDLRDPEDPFGWHDFPAPPGPSLRRARRIDVWRDADIQIDAHFQDSAAEPDGGRSALHEYRLRATVDADTGTLLAVAAEPRVLPFAECPGAVPNVARLIGLPLADLRETVPVLLKGTAGCTHLNDALRALAEAPVLAAHLDAMQKQGTP